MTATERRYFTIVVMDGYVLASVLFSFAVACSRASRRGDTGGRVYELSDDGTVRLVAQMATVS
jgi:hypothetical protein